MSSYGIGQGFERGVQLMSESIMAGIRLGLHQKRDDRRLQS